MIEFLDIERCTTCNICVRVCPANVFSVVPGSVPIIARQDDCQTCFMCEVYCPVDALYVHPNSERPVIEDRSQVLDENLLGSYRRTIGWTSETRARRATDASYKILKD
jgi:MinD superfamily P-loop ATPase